MLMTRIKHILVVVDPSAGARQAAVDKAAHLARPFGASIELLICDVESARDDNVFVRTVHPSNTELLDLLDGLAAPLLEQGLRVSKRLIYGKSLHGSLLDYIRESAANLVIKDTHHHSFVRRTFLTNTDWYLAHDSTVPLMLTKNKEWRRPPVVMAAVDPKTKGGEDGSILNCAASLAARLDGHLHVIHAFVPAAFAAALATGTLCKSRDYTDAVQVENSYRYRQIQHLVSVYGVAPRHLHVEMGTPKDCLTSRVAQHDVDVVVIGASPHGRWHRMLIGSTGSEILESLPCDILIARSPDLKERTGEHRRQR
jgi:universal stress protein E